MSKNSPVQGANPFPLCRFIFLTILFAGFMFINACDSAKEQAEQKQQTQQKDDITPVAPASQKEPRPAAGDGQTDTQVASPAPEAKAPWLGQDKRALSVEERETAARLLAFRNRAVGNFSAGYYALPEILRHNADIYALNWQLPPSPRIKGRKRDARAMEPEQGLFDKQEAEDMASALLAMDKALANMLGHYRDLEKYIRDDTIRDDGRQGREICAKLGDEHASFIKARDSWLGIVEKRAQEAESALIAGDPLERQILTARQILAQGRQVANLLKSGAATRDIVAPICQSMAELIIHGGKPPFPAPPSLERLYRAFLRTGSAYVDTLRTALDEGFHNRQKRELATAFNRCQVAYNEFARAANMLPADGR